MVAMFIWLGTALVGENALGVRLLGPVSLFIGSLMLARSTEDLFPGRGAGPWAAALMNATLFAALGAVTMTPDTPLLFFWVATLWAVARAQRSGDARWWLAAGIFAGGALLSKYTAALLGFGLVLWLVLLPEARRWLLRWQLSAGGALAVALFAPVILWNAAHEWASFAKQGGRTAAGGAGQSLRWLGELLGGQVALVTPLVFLLCVAGAVMAARQVWRVRNAAAGLLLALILPGAVIFAWQALGSRVQGNWPPPLCCPLAGCGFAYRPWSWALPWPAQPICKRPPRPSPCRAGRTQRWRGSAAGMGWRLIWRGPPRVKVRPSSRPRNMASLLAWPFACRLSFVWWPWTRAGASSPCQSRPKTRLAC
jgi:4-amino-4-deoxy-L-arabinose transferase-like glycosyltransferase